MPKLRIRRRILIFLAAITVALTAVFGGTVYAAELPDERFVPSVVTVVYGTDASAELRFNWKTAEWCDSDVQLVEGVATASDFGENAIYVHERNAEQSRVDGETAYIHSCTVSGLKPNTEYSYRVGDIELEWSDVGHVKTAGDGAFNFLHMSDPQGWTEEHYARYRETLSVAFDKFPDHSFIALTGDIVNNSWAEHTPILSQWEWAFDSTKDYAMNTVFAPVAGNHEAANNDFASRFNLPVPQNSETVSGAYYSFNYGRAHFLGVNTNDFISDGAGGYAMSKAQEDFIRADLAAHKDYDWKIVLQHKGFYTTGSHCNSDDPDIPYVRAQIASVYSECGVDLVLQGHDHLFVRTQPTVTSGESSTVGAYKDYTVSGKQVMLSPTGTVYCNSATASGSKQYGIVGYDSNIIHVQRTGELTAGQTMFTSYRVDGKTLTAETYIEDKDGAVKLYDSWAIRKTPEQDIVALVEALPSPDKIASSDADAVIEANSLYNALGKTGLSSAASKKLADCLAALNSVTGENFGGNGQTTDLTWLWIVLGVVGALAIAAAVIVVLIKKNVIKFPQNSQPETINEPEPNDEPNNTDQPAQTENSEENT